MDRLRALEARVRRAPAAAAVLRRPLAVVADRVEVDAALRPAPAERLDALLVPLDAAGRDARVIRTERAPVALLRDVRADDCVLKAFSLLNGHWLGSLSCVGCN